MLEVITGWAPWRRQMLAAAPQHWMPWNYRQTLERLSMASTATAFSAERELELPENA